MKKNNIQNYVLDEENGRKVRYVGQYYVTNVPAKARRKSAICKLAAGGLELLLILAAISVNCLGSRKAYIILPLELILFCALYYLIGAYTYLKSGDRIEQKVYDKAYSNPVQIVTVAAVLNLIALIGQAMLTIRQAEELNGYDDYTFLAILMGLLVLHMLMWKQQKRLFGQIEPEKQTEFE